ncbi:MAG: hypothetical protein AAB444_03690 [Patescibacteria group bacterium]
MKKIIIGIFTIFVLGFILLAAPIRVFAAETSPPPKPEGVQATGAFLDAAGFTVLKQASGQDARLYVVALIRVALSFTGFLFFLLMFYGGYLWLSAGGNDEQMKKAKAVLTRAVIGFAVVFAAYSVTLFVSRIIVLSSLPEGYVPKQKDTTWCDWIGVGCEK